jgi:hypothetical protein
MTKGTITFCAGVLLISFGLAGFQYKRWDHAYNRTVIPVFHPWAILVGIALIWYSRQLDRPKRPRR